MSFAGASNHTIGPKSFVEWCDFLIKNSRNKKNPADLCVWRRNNLGILYEDTSVEPQMIYKSLLSVVKVAGREPSSVTAYIGSHRSKPLWTGVLMFVSTCNKKLFYRVAPIVLWDKSSWGNAILRRAHTAQSLGASSRTWKRRCFVSCLIKMK